MARCWWILLFCSVSHVEAGNVSTWRIMPMGDSNTVGYGWYAEGTHPGWAPPPNGYRCILSDLLNQNGIQHELVGKFQSRCGGFAGWSGWTLFNIAGSAVEAVVQSQPDVIMLEAGTNDFFLRWQIGANWLPTHAGADVSGTADRLEALLQELFQARPNVIVALSTVLPVDNGRCFEYYAFKQPHCPLDLHANVNAFNARLPGIVANQQALGRNVVLHDVSANANFANEDFQDDGIHFTRSGYTKIAQAWLAALIAIRGQVQSSQFAGKYEVQNTNLRTSREESLAHLSVLAICFAGVAISVSAVLSFIKCARIAQSTPGRAVHQMPTFADAEAAPLQPDIALLQVE